MKRSGTAYVLLTLLCLAFFWPGIRTIPAIDRDEARFAEASRQMAATHDFADIRFQDETRYKKPIGIYWLQSAAVLALGENPDNPHMAVSPAVADRRDYSGIGDIRPGKCNSRMDNRSYRRFVAGGPLFCSTSRHGWQPPTPYCWPQPR